MWKTFGCKTAKKLCENQKTGTERALRNSSGTSEATDLITSRPSKDQDVRILAEDKSLASNLTKTLFAFVLII